MATIDATKVVRAYTPRKWRMDAGQIDTSTNAKNLSFIVPQELKPPQFYSQSNPSQLTFVYDSPGSYQFAAEAYIEIGLQLIDSGTGQTYASGAPVAFAPGIASTFFDKFLLQYGGETIMNPPNNHSRSSYLMNVVNYSYDYLISGQYQQTAFLIDAPGQGQNTSGLGIVGTGSQATSYAIPGNGYYVPATKYVIAFSNETNATGPIYTLPGTGLTSATQDVLSALTTNQFTTLVTTTPTATTVTNTTGTLSATNLNGVVSVTLPGASTAGQVVTTAPNSTVGGYYPILLQSNTDNTNFWLRQSLTNQTAVPANPGGNYIWNARIRLSEFIPYYQSYRSFEKGLTWQLQCFPGNVNDMVQIAATYPGGVTGTVTAVNPASIWVNNMWLVMPSEIPSRFLMDELDKSLINGAIFQHAWTNVYTIPVTTMASTATAMTQQFNMPTGILDWLVFQFVPQSYLNVQTANQQVSIVPQQANGGCLLSNSQINYQDSNYPNPGYGNYPTDNVRMYETFLEMAGRWNNELFGPPITFQQFLNGQFFLTFDLRGRQGTSTAQTTIQPNINLASAIGVTTQVYAIGIKKQKSQYEIERLGSLDSVRMRFKLLV